MRIPDEIVAIGAARPVERPGMGVLPCYYNEKGTNLHVDLLVDTSSDERSILALVEIAKQRFPQCKTVAMFRHFEESLHVYEIQRFWKFVQKIRRKRKEKQHELAQL